MDDSNSQKTPVESDDSKVVWWTLTVAEALAELQTHAEHGLSEAEVEARRQQYGRNELKEEPPLPVWRRVFEHFNQLVIWILIVAAAISGMIGDWIDAVAILAIVVLNVAIGVFQEERAGKALAALRQMSSPLVRAVRKGSLQSISAGELVPGDIIVLEAGDNIPADARLVSAYGFRAQEATLTGESAPVDKEADTTLAEATGVGDRRNMSFMGASAAGGRATAVVVATGMETELGQIAGMLQQHRPEPTPLQQRLAGLGRVLIVVCLVVVAVVFMLNLYRGGEFLEVLLLSISLAVAAVPEGMPAVVTVTLAVGLQRMVKRNALIRRLPSVETLGAVTVICSDKTGTLTRNEMTVREALAGETRYRITGTGYSPSGKFVPLSTAGEQGEADAVDPATDGALMATLTIGARCNEASLRRPSEAEAAWTIVGDPTEGALLVAAAKADIELSHADQELVHELPFDSERKAMSVVFHRNGRTTMYTKGAPEVILARCTTRLGDGGSTPLTDEHRDDVKEVASAMASRALRVLALAQRDVTSLDENEYSETDLEFAGLVGMIDPPREEAIKAVAQCREAGIRPVMITGDHPETALAIAREIGIAGDDDRLVPGDELDAMPDEELLREVTRIAVYARVSAKHKHRVVKAWQHNHAVVAMTGDGVNDAPAVKAADIGIAMGITGSDVTKDAADMVLTDDNFASIVSAVEEGRGIFDNIQKFIQYLLSCNAGEVLLMLLSAIAGWPAPLSALQILWINLVTDGLPALALGMEPPEHDIMRRSPRDKREPVITTAGGVQILTHGLLMACVAAGCFWWVYQGDSDRLPLAQSAAFFTVAFMQLVYALACRSQNETMPEIGPFSNPYLLGAIAGSAAIQFSIAAIPAAREVFGVADGIFSQGAPIMVAALTPVTVIELWKFVRRWQRGRRTAAVDAERP